MSDLSSSVALVTGASRGIGKGCALELGAAGATVYVTGRTTDDRPDPLPGTVDQTAREINRLGGRGIPVALDQRDDAAVESLVARIGAAHDGRLDILVNSAFAMDPEVNSGKSFWELPLSSWDDQMAIGTRSAYVTSRSVAPLMIRRGRGLIVNISSYAASRYAWQAAYGVAKCALDRLTSDTAHELAGHGVSVVSVWPGFTLTERNQIEIDRGLDTDGVDVAHLETTRFTGRAVVALATDPAVHEHSGQAFWTRKLAIAYGFSDVSGALPGKAAFPQPSPPPRG